MRIDARVVLLAAITLFRRLLVLPETPELRIETLGEVRRGGPLPTVLDVIEIPQQHMSEGRGETHVGGDQVADVCAREPRDALLLQQTIVDGEVGVEDGGLVVDVVRCAVRGAIEKELREERKVVGPPDVAVVDGHEEDDASEVSDAAVDQGVQRHPKGRAQGGNVLPIERNGQEPETFVSGRAAEKVGEDQVVLRGQTEDGDALEDGEDVLREHFPKEDDDENDVEDLELAPGLPLVPVEGFKEGGDWQIDGPQQLGRVHQDFSEEPSNAEADQLRGDCDENACRVRRVATVEELLRGKCLSGQGGLRGRRSHERDGGMLLEVERVGIEPFSNGSSSWNDKSKTLAENVGKDGQEDDGDVDCLRLEIEDFLEGGAEDGQSDAFAFVSWFSLSRFSETPFLPKKNIRKVQGFRVGSSST